MWWEWNSLVVLTTAETPVKSCVRIAANLLFLERVESTNWRMMVAFQPDVRKSNVDWLERFQCHRVAVFLFTSQFKIDWHPKKEQQFMPIRFYFWTFRAWFFLLVILKGWNIQPFRLIFTLTYSICNYQFQPYKNPMAQSSYSFFLNAAHSTHAARKKRIFSPLRPNAWAPIRPRFGWLLKLMLENPVGSFGWSNSYFQMYLGCFGVILHKQFASTVSDLDHMYVYYMNHMTTQLWKTWLYTYITDI